MRVCACVCLSSSLSLGVIPTSLVSHTSRHHVTHIKTSCHAERNNIVCDTGKYEGGSMIFIIDPCDPKTRVFKPNYNGGHIALPREKGQEAVCGGIRTKLHLPISALKLQC